MAFPTTKSTHWYSSAVLAGVIACSSPPPAAEPARPAPAPDVVQIADEFYTAYVETYPEIGDWSAAPDKQYSRLDDNSLTALAAWQQREDDWLRRLRAVDVAALDDQHRVLHAALLEEIEASVGARVCRRELWRVDHMWGWQSRYPLMMSKQPVATPGARRDALARWRELPRVVDTEIDILREGVAQGYTSPRVVVDAVLSALDAEIALPIEQSAYYKPARRAGDDAFSAQWRALVEKHIHPSLRAYRDFLRDEYRAAARTNLAITAHPDGAACYAALFRSYTTLDRPAADTLAMGEALVARNAAEVAELGEALFGTRELSEVVAAVKADASYALADGEAVLAFARAVNDRAARAAPQWFADVPPIPAVVEPWPETLDQAGAGDHYEGPSSVDDKGVYRISLRAEKRHKGNLEVTTLHELVPGHHLQVAFAVALGDRHRAMTLLGNSSFAEGWARYSEALAEEMGVLTLDGSKVLRRSWPGRGMVADIGLHLGGWTPEQAVAYMQEAGRFADEYVATLPARMAMMPGQLTAYDTGATEIFRLRQLAERRLGDAFDIREFHARVLERGNVPLWLLREHVEAWIQPPL